MFLHVSEHAREVLEKADVAQLVELVWTDGLNRAVALDVRNIGRARGERGDAGAGEGDLGRRAEHDGAIRVTRLGARSEYVRELVAFGIEVVHGIGVVPKQPKIERRCL